MEKCNTTGHNILQVKMGNTISASEKNPLSRTYYPAHLNPQRHTDTVYVVDSMTQTEKPTLKVEQTPYDITFITDIVKVNILPEQRVLEQAVAIQTDSDTERTNIATQTRLNETCTLSSRGGVVIYCRN